MITSNLKFTQKSLVCSLTEAHLSSFELPHESVHRNKNLEFVRHISR